MAVLQYYEECASDINFSLDEYLAAKLLRDYLIAVEGETQPAVAISPSMLPSTGPSNVTAIDTRSRKKRATGQGSGYKGVYAYGKRWEAVLYAGNKRHRLGVFDNPEEAAHAYDLALIAQAGTTEAAVNFPTAKDIAVNEGSVFIEKLTTSNLTENDWDAWRSAAPIIPGLAPVPGLSLVKPPIRGENEEPDRTPLIHETKPPKSLYRRGETLADTLHRMGRDLPDPITEDISQAAADRNVEPIEPEPTPPDPDE